MFRSCAAPVGQAETHVPHPSHRTSFTSATPAGFSDSALYGHIVTQTPHPPHNSSSIATTSGEWVNFSLASSAIAFAAAPLPCATDSGISFGPWPAPATNTPAIRLSTGRNFGCASFRNPSLPQLILRIREMAEVLGCGSIDRARTTRSAFSSTRFPERVSAPQTTT